MSTLRDRQRQELLDTIARMRAEGKSTEEIAAAIGLRPATITLLERRAERAANDPIVKRKALMDEMQQLLFDQKVNNPDDLDPILRMRYRALGLQAATEACRAKARPHLITPEGKATERALEGLRLARLRKAEKKRRMRETIREMLPMWDAQGRSRQALCRELRISPTTLYKHIKALRAESPPA